MPPPPPTSEEPHGADSGSAGGVVLPLVPGLGRRPTRRRPLPDAAGVRLLRVPDSSPPYDDGLAETGPDGRPSPAARAPQPAARPARPGPGGTTTRPAATRKAPAQPSPPAARGTAADARWPSQFAQVLAETLAGSRPQGQIRPWTTDQARRSIRQLGPSLAAGVQPRIRRIVTSRPATGVVEMTVVVGFGPRIRALAVRLEHETGPRRTCGTGRGDPPGPGAAAARWICTAIEAA
jgi:Family of unknown function (DUF6459)